MTFSFPLLHNKHLSKNSRKYFQLDESCRCRIFADFSASHSRGKWKAIFHCYDPGTRVSFWQWFKAKTINWMKLNGFALLLGVRRVKLQINTIFLCLFGKTKNSRALGLLKSVFRRKTRSLFRIEITGNCVSSQIFNGGMFPLFTGSHTSPRMH